MFYTRLSSVITFIAACSLTIGTAAAQATSSSSAASSESTSSATSSSSSVELPNESPDLLGNRTLRIQDFRKLTLKFQTSDRQYHERRAQFLKKRAELHTDCRDQLRRSNRDTKSTIVLSCYKQELKLEREFLNQEQTYLQEVPGVSKLIRRNVITQQTLLTDALDAIMTAIDSRLYTSEEEIIEARTNLRTKYRVPYMEALTLTRIDRLLSWNDFLLAKLDDAIAEELKEQGVVRPELGEVRLCLRHSEMLARDAVTNQEITSSTFTDLSSKLDECVTSLKAIPNIRVKNGSGEVIAAPKP